MRERGDPSRERRVGEGLSVAITLTRLAMLGTLSRGAGEGLPQELPLRRRLILHRAQEAGFRGRGAIRIAGAEFLELRRVAREGGVVQGQREPAAGACLYRRAHPVDRGDEARVVGVAADPQ